MILLNRSSKLINNFRKFIIKLQFFSYFSSLVKTTKYLIEYNLDFITLILQQPPTKRLANIADKPTIDHM